MRRKSASGFGGTTSRDEHQFGGTEPGQEACRSLSRRSRSRRQIAAAGWPGVHPVQVPVQVAVGDDHEHRAGRGRKDDEPGCPDP